MNSPRPLITDIERELVEPLKRVARDLDEVPDDPYAWKWVVIALHNALQHAIVVSISGTDNLGALRPDLAEK